jgi:hypothetical protein
MEGQDKWYVFAVLPEEVGEPALQEFKSTGFSPDQALIGTWRPDEVEVQVQAAGLGEAVYLDDMAHELKETASGDEFARRLSDAVHQTGREHIIFIAGCVAEEQAEDAARILGHYLERPAYQIEACGPIKSDPVRSQPSHGDETPGPSLWTEVRATFSPAPGTPKPIRPNPTEPPGGAKLPA